MNPQTPQTPSPEENSFLHHALVMSNALQALPPPLVVTSFLVNSALVGIFWLGRGSGSAAALIGLAVLAASAINWALLRRLPVAGRSWGPDKPAALGLSAAQALTAALFGLLGASVGLTILVVIGISALAYYATWIEPFNLGVTRQTLTTDAWQRGLQPDAASCLRMLHVSDIHVERAGVRERRLNALIAELKPDLIVFTGDFVNISYTNDPQSKADIRAILKQWDAPLGVYCVPGTPQVEPLARVVEFVQGLENVTLLTNRWHTVETPCGALHILGLITTHDLPTDRAALARMMESAPEGGVKLLLAHSPDIAPESAAAGLDLMLCGHTHGGQIRLPLIGAVVTSSQLGKRFAMGRYTVQQMTLYVSRGVGLEGLGAPRARFLCPPEIILWDFNNSS